MRYTKHLIVIVLIGLLCVVFKKYNTKLSPSIVSLQTVQGIEVAFPPEKGDWIVLNLWASWCGPCKEEIVELNHLYENYPNIKVVGINVENLTDFDLARSIQELGIRYPVLKGLQNLNLPKIQGVPTTLILSSSSEWLPPLLGKQTESDILDAIHQTLN